MESSLMYLENACYLTLEMQLCDNALIMIWKWYASFNPSQQL